MRENITAFWVDLDAGKKRVLTLVGAAVFVIGLLYALVSKSEVPPRPERPKEIVRHPLTGKKSKSLDMDALAGELQRIRQSMQDSQDQTQSYIAESKKDRKNDLVRFEEKIARTKSEYQSSVGRLEDEIKELQQSEVLAAPAAGTSGNQKAPSKTKPDNPKKIKYQNLNSSEWERLLEDAERNVETPPDNGNEVPGTPNIYGGDPGSSKNQQAKAGRAEPEQASVHIYGGEDKDSDGDNSDSSSNDSDSENAPWLSAGSVFSGVLLNGLDAPTSASAKKDPFPVIFRIKKETIMPNFFSMDLEECFVIATGFGDLSSERAYFRAERLSCVRDDGTPIEQKIDAAAVGPDGKTGVRGRLVERNGRLIAMSILSGSLSGLSDIFRPAAITSVRTSPDSKTLFETPDPTEAAKAGTASGVSNALEKIAEYYMERADAVYPLIQVDAGINIDFMVLQGTYIKPKIPKKTSTN